MLVLRHLLDELSKALHRNEITGIPLVKADGKGDNYENNCIDLRKKKCKLRNFYN